MLRENGIGEKNRLFPSISGCRFMLCAAFLLFANSALANENEIDISRSTNVCQELGQAIGNYLKKPEGLAKRGKLVVRGHAKIQYADLVDIGEYRVCAHLGPALSLNAKFGVTSEKINLHSNIHFDDVRIEYDPKGQDEPVVLFQLGSFYNYGPGKTKAGTSGSIKIGGRLSGDLTIILEPNSSGLVGGMPMIPHLPFNSGFSKTSTIAWFETGISRLDMTRLSLTIQSYTKDYDDVGLLHQHAWGIRRGPIRISKLGVGMLFYGNSVGTIANSYIYNNEYGLVLGDTKNGGGIIFSSDCRKLHGESHAADCKPKNSVVSGLVVRDSVIEGNNRGNLIINDADRIDFESVHFEMPLLKNQRGHGILIGGGVCRPNKETEQNLCGTNQECGGGVCKALNKMAINGIRFNGGIISGDRFSDNWDGLVIGPSAKATKYGPNQVFFSTTVKLSDMNTKPNLINKCGSPGVRCGAVTVSNTATVKLEFSSANYIHRFPFVVPLD